MIRRMRYGEKDGLHELIKELPNNIVMAEIGCYAGESTLMFIDSGKVNKLYAIDPWKNGYDNRDPASRSDMKLVEQTFDENLRGRNVVKLKMTMEEAMDKLPELDMIYIDGNHTYEAVLSDVLFALKKVKKNGIIAGHDYRKNNPIVMVVKETFGKPNKTFPDSSWMVINNIDNE